MKLAPRLALLLLASVLSLHAQLAQLSPPTLETSLGDLPKPPVPVDSNGNPIQSTHPTTEEVEAQKREQQKRQDQIRAQEEKQAAEQRLRDELRESEHRAEERDAQNQNRTLLYVVLAVVATIIASRLFKSSAK